MNWANIQDPRYHNESRRLLVFWNSAEPVQAFASQCLSEVPANVVWSPRGDQVAFTAGATLHVWWPARE